MNDVLNRFLEKDIIHLAHSCDLIALFKSTKYINYHCVKDEKPKY